MSTPGLRLIRSDPIAPPAQTKRRRLGQILVDRGDLKTRTLFNMLRLQRKLDAPLGEVLVSEGLVKERDVLEAISTQRGVRITDLTAEPPDTALQTALDPHFCLRHRVVPWMRLGQTLLVATARPDQFQSVRRALPAGWEDALPIFASEAQIMEQLETWHAGDLAPLAERRVSDTESCRTWQKGVSFQRLALGLLAVVALTALVLWPAITIAVISAWALFTLTVAMLTKIAALCAQGFRRTRIDASPDMEGITYPRISVLVPLLHEEDIANALVRRLKRLTYPKALLDVVLVLEGDDAQTKATLARTNLPPWMRVVEVPATGSITTKPRAMNYALDYCRGDIIGVWDAEDAPQEDQLERVAHHFAHAPPEVACLQGVLDYYNAKTNWLSRCFTIEYAAWWRILLPGIARLGWVIPLGGTTLFFKRDVLDKLDRWDAHNVTEDADLGVRLARHGYRTELIGTVTHEEANFRPWRWIRQRSRWLKGYMITYLVHMRHPLTLLRQLGLWRFIGLQMFFITTVSQFVFAPVIWSFALIPFGVAHPAVSYLGPWAMGLAVMLLVFEGVTWLVNGIAVSGRGHRHLLVWVPTMIFYYPLAAIASYKALYELIGNPFYWDKTEHGVTLSCCDDLPNPAVDAS